MDMPSNGHAYLGRPDQQWMLVKLPSNAFHSFVDADHSLTCHVSALAGPFATESNPVRLGRLNGFRTPCVTPYCCEEVCLGEEGMPKVYGNPKSN
jgi:hypothetical protein